MAYWTFNQNNSGGSFVFDKERGLTHNVIIEANSMAEAIDRAESIGIYFDGCNDGMDCPCCGDRWSRPWKNDASEFPEVYGRDIRTERNKDGWGSWMQEGFEHCVHPLNGPIEWYAA